jgi:hypothetical protein
MFEVEYRTVSRLGATYPSRIALIGSHKALSCDDAKVYFLSKIRNIEVIGVRYIGVA